MGRIDKLIAEMTIAEKLGQLTMTAAGYAVTGPVIAGDSTDAIKSGWGLNMWCGSIIRL
jgi:beta-glucosidase